MPAPQPDRTVADAIDRVLEAERTAAAVIVAAEDQARATIDAAREARHRILERARQRSGRLHERAEARLADRLAHLDVELGQGVAAAIGLRLVASDALDAVVERLTTGDPP